jgi:hypothetical protein
MSVARVMLACCPRVLFVFPSCFLRILLIFLASRPRWSLAPIRCGQRTHGLHHLDHSGRSTIQTGARRPGLLERQFQEFALPGLEADGVQPGAEGLFENIDFVEAADSGSAGDVFLSEVGGLAGDFTQVQDDAL